MVVLSIAITTKSGKPIIARQSISIPSSRVELLLNSFPKLIPPGSQHTSVSSDDVRFVYQPFEEVYIVLLTTLQSNILLDIQTLSLVAKIVADVARAMTEVDILDNAFELVAAFDEIVSMGVSESLSFSALKTIMGQDSHEERIQDILNRNKENDAIEEQKRRVKQMEMKKREAQRVGGTGGGGGGGGGGGMHAGGFSSGGGGSYQSVPSSAPPVQDKYTVGSAGAGGSVASPAFKGKGMKLGKKKGPDQF